MQAGDEIPYDLSSLTGLCDFDGGTPAEFENLERNPKVSLGGDACSVFEIWVGPIDDYVTVDGDGNVVIDVIAEGPITGVNIPRAEIFTWQQCRFSNVMTEVKIDEYALDYASDEEETQDLVVLWGVCGKVEDPDADPDADIYGDPAPDQDGIFVPTGYDVRILKAN